MSPIIRTSDVRSPLMLIDVEDSRESRSSSSQFPLAQRITESHSLLDNEENSDEEAEKPHSLGPSIASTYPVVVRPSLWRSSRVRIGLLLSVCILLLLCAQPFGAFTSITDIDGEDAGRLSAVSRAGTNCDDPWALPGFTWYGDTTRDVSYISYKYLKKVVNESHAETLDPEKHFEETHANTLPEEFASLPQLSTMFERRKSGGSPVADLEFLRNRHVAALGSSLDREAIMNFCTQHGAAVNHRHYRWAYCHFEDYNLTISQWMHVGSHQSDWHNGGDDARVGIHIEDRVNGIFLPLAEKYGQPDLLLFSLGFWDLKYLHFSSMRHNPNLPREKFEPLTFNELSWHRARLSQVISFLRASFPKSVLMYRTTTEIGARRSAEDDEPIEIFQLNQSSKSLMKKLRIPLFNWSDLVRGDNEHRDTLHFKQDSRANTLYGEMLLWHLKQIVQGTQDPACWVDR